jgi:Ca2+-binding RTX toxin-like protein
MVAKTTNDNELQAFDFTSNNSVNAILYTLKQRWQLLQNNQITYSFLNSQSYFGYPTQFDFKDEEEDISPLDDTTLQTSIKNDIFSRVFSSVIAVNFQEKTETIVTNPNGRKDTTDYGTIRIMNRAFNDPNTVGKGIIPGNNPYNRMLEGDLYLKKTQDYSIGTFGYASIIHEIGHTLGLKHPFDTGSYDSPGTTLPRDKDNNTNTVMTYNANGKDSYSAFDDGQAVSLMPYDILALQYLYGAREKNAEDTVYTFTAVDNYSVNGESYYSFGTGHSKSTLWDSSGNDTLDLSALGAPQLGSKDGFDYRFDMAQGETLSENFAYEGATYKAYDPDKEKWEGQFKTLRYGTVLAFSPLDNSFDATIENLFGTNWNDYILGNRVANLIKANDGDDRLEGKEGDDTLDGGNGNDTASYLTSTTGVIVNLSTGQATGGDASGDVLNSIEYLEGSKFGDTLTGDSQNNYLWGMEGDDILDGGLGNDLMFGGVGNDIYYVNIINDIVTEYSNASNADNDNVFSTITYKLGENVENLTLIGNSVINGTGNSLNNIITGNDTNNILNSNAGNDTILGGNGDDKLIGGAGADILSGGDGKDTASYFTATTGVTASLSESQNNTGDAQGDVYQSIENLEGSEFADRLFGDNLNNTLIGLGGDDFLDDYGNDDTLIGGTGSDTYNVDSAGDIVTETIDEGIDTVNASINYTLTANVENLNLLEGTSALNGTGNELNNIINGNSAKNIIDGGAGDDILFGFALGDTLIGGDGNDWLVGGQGNDILTGGGGDDYFVYNAITDAGDRIYDFTVGTDKLVFTDLLNNLGYHGANAIADGVLGFRQASANLGIVQIDPDGSAGNLFRATPFILLNDVSVAALSNSNSFVL